MPIKMGVPPDRIMLGEAGGGAGEARDLPDTRRARRCAKTIENISRIRMVVARASGTLMASSLKQNELLTLGWHPGGLVCGSGARLWCAGLVHHLGAASGVPKANIAKEYRIMFEDVGQFPNVWC